MPILHSNEHRDRYLDQEQALSNKNKPGLQAPLHLFPQADTRCAHITFQLMEWFRYILVDKDIRVFMNDCADNNLPECKTQAETPLLLLFNRILIRYSGDPTNLECKTVNM